MNVTQNQAKAFLMAILGGDCPYEDSELIRQSPVVVAFLDGALPEFGAQHPSDLWNYTRHKPLRAEAAARVEEFASFLEGVARCLRDPDEGSNTRYLTQP